ncbi:hypothetical protein GCM10009802_00160 [Streptomyces synnematoformans]|uniref:Uncharacterized protein n=1 Tax=Streptomyces synnematoformans TaxID=415721 RepID=A0ABN2X687_9ACTN
MALISRGFHGRRPPASTKLPPGQYETTGFPVLSAGPTPRVRREGWELPVTTEAGKRHVWDWAGLTALPADSPNIPLADLVDGKAWIAYGYGGSDLAPEHGGPARLLGERRLPRLRRSMARAAVPGRPGDRLRWRIASVTDRHAESETAVTLTLDLPDWPGHLAGQHVSGSPRKTATAPSAATRSPRPPTAGPWS